MRKNSLVLLGSGIKFLSHLTIEAKSYIEQAEKLLYLVNEPLMKDWLKNINKSSESLDALYNSKILRKESYHAITQYILATVRNGFQTCVVMYGHPTFFAQPGLNAVKQAKKEGYDVLILPGISAEACLFADLLIDPGSCGYQSFEASDLLIRQKKIDNSCHVILWQIDIIGALTNPINFDNKRGCELLISYLANFYKLSHQAIVYEAAQYPGFKPKIITTTIKDLYNIQFSRVSSLYIPPEQTLPVNKMILDQLQVKYQLS